MGELVAFPARSPIAPTIDALTPAELRAMVSGLVLVAEAAITTLDSLAEMLPAEQQALIRTSVAAARTVTGHARGLIS